MSIEAILQKLRYMGRQYSAGKVSRGGRPEKHYLEEAADLLEQLASENTELRQRAERPSTENRKCGGCGAEYSFDEGFWHKCAEEKVIITAAKIELYGFNRPRTEGEGHSCRTAANEACAWAIKRLGEELEKSVAYVRTGQPIDNVVICN